MTPRTKAYAITAPGVEANALAWADTPESARELACSEAWFDSINPADMQCERQPTLDGLRPHSYCACEAPTVDDYRLMRQLGWHEVDNEGPPCKRCNENVFSEVLESHLDENEICGECRKKVPHA